MVKLDIIIPTYKRVEKQKTFNSLPSFWKARTYFVVNSEEAPELKKLYVKEGAIVIVHPSEINSIGKKRAWILKQKRWDKILMLDDDLFFASKKTGSNSLTLATEEEIGKAFFRISRKLNSYMHVGILPRLGANNKPSKGWIENSRAIYALGYKASEVRKICELGRVELREDMELTLQLLTKGFPNAILCDICLEQSYNASGGCSEDRTVELGNKQAILLNKLFPEFVTVTKREYKTGARFEVVVAWEKAYLSSQKKGFFK